MIERFVRQFGSYRSHDPPPGAHHSATANIKVLASPYGPADQCLTRKEHDNVVLWRPKTFPQKVEAATKAGVIDADVQRGKTKFSFRYPYGTAIHGLCGSSWFWCVGHGYTGTIRIPLCADCEEMKDMYHEADNSVQCKCKLHVTRKVTSMTIPPFISNQSMARKMIFILWFSEATVMTSD